MQRVQLMRSSRETGSYERLVRNEGESLKVWGFVGSAL